MNPVAVAILWAYTGLLVAGGVMGFLKAGSRASLIASVACAIPLGLVAAHILPAVVAYVVLALLVVVFARRFAKTRSVMPAGMLVVLSAVTAAVLLWFQYGAPKA